MQVKVSTQCPRCSKKTVMDMSLEDAVKVEESQRNEAAALASMKVSVTEAMQSCPVDSFILVAFKNADGSYAMETLSNLCTGQRSCESKVTSLIKEMFVPAKQPTPKKKDEVAEVAIPATLVDVDDEDLDG